MNNGETTNYTELQSNHNEKLPVALPYENMEVGHMRNHSTLFLHQLHSVPALTFLEIVKYLQKAMYQDSAHSL